MSELSVPADLRHTRVNIPGTTNLRDLGGFPAMDGRSIRPGVLFRAEALARPGEGVARVALWDDAHIDRYQALGLSLVIDLRAQHESDLAPSAWAEPSAATLRSIPINEGGEGDATDYVRQLREGTLRSFTADDLAQYYSDTLRRRATQFGEAIAVIGQPGGVPVLVHCAAGKDRTGLLVALILCVLGTPRDLIVADYTLTETFRPNRVGAYADVLAAGGIEPAAVSALFETPAHAMELVLEGIDAEFGSVQQFLIERAGVTVRDMNALREGLLTTP